MRPIVRKLFWDELPLWSSQRGLQPGSPIATSVGKCGENISARDCWGQKRKLPLVTYQGQRGQSFSWLTDYDCRQHQKGKNISARLAEVKCESYHWWPIKVKYGSTPADWQNISGQRHMHCKALLWSGTYKDLITGRKLSWESLELGARKQSWRESWEVVLKGVLLGANIGHFVVWLTKQVNSHITLFMHLC